MKRYTISVPYTVIMNCAVEVEINDDQDESDALSLAAEKAPIPNDANVGEFTIEDATQFELTDQDILDEE